MKVGGLISGGKDSIFNLQLSRDLGHDLVCLGNVHPEKIREVNSYMFQSVGGEFVESLAKNLKLPLETEILEINDELLSLRKLLKKMKKHGIEAISCGAVLSNYQRSRVESLCGDLNLICLAFMWRQPEIRLLEQMMKTGMKVRIVKVASYGLQREDCGKMLNSDLIQKFLKLQKDGFHVSGEGGEYETLCLDSSLHECEMRIQNSKEIIDCKDIYAPVVYLKDGSMALHRKNEKEKQRQLEEAKKVVEFLEKDYFLDFPNYEFLEYPEIKIEEKIPHSIMKITKLGSRVSTSFTSLSDYGLEEKEFCDEVRKLLENLRKSLDSFDEVFLVEARLQKISQFWEFDKVYAEFFPLLTYDSCPPARVCCEMPIESRIELRILAGKAEIEDRQIFSRSLSFWIPPSPGHESQMRKLENYVLCSSYGFIPHINERPSSKAEELFFAVRSIRNSLESINFSLNDISLLQVLVNSKTSLPLSEVELFLKQRLFPGNYLINSMHVVDLPRQASFHLLAHSNLECRFVGLPETSEDYFFDLFSNEDPEFHEWTGFIPCFEKTSLLAYRF